jgi:hypothetical protein
MKWLIPDPAHALTQESRQEYWETLHREQDYANVYSLTDDDALCARISNMLKERACTSVWIPGCGSRVNLQRTIVDGNPQVAVLCTDFPFVVEMARRRYTDRRCTYLGLDSTVVPNVKVDAVVHVTSIVSESDRENRQMLRASAEALHAGGLLIGVFPTVFATLDIAYVTGEIWRAEAVDLSRSTYTEPVQKVSQIFYTPLRLRLALREAGFALGAMEVFFNDSRYLQEQGSRHYGLHDPDAALYHLLVRGER